MIAGGTSSHFDSIVKPWESLPTQTAAFHSESRRMTLVVALRGDDGLFLGAEDLGIEAKLHLAGWSKILKPKWPALCGWSGDVQTAKWIERSLRKGRGAVEKSV